ncbi:hypothetical protein PQX77_005217 [Marasmius sp. AFHP31]|nr:hypothetical protein PQX77_005217 [Marasmius sp. AFHP31]
MASGTAPTPISIHSLGRPSRKLGLPFRNVVTDFDQRLIKQILIDGDEELKKCDTELNRLNAIIGVQSKRAGIQKEMETYRALLSPIQRMPPEILTEIFMLCVMDIKNLHAMEDIMMISVVCGRWRELALSVPALWSRIDLSIGRSCREDSNYPRMRRYAETFLERSGNAQLAVALEWPELCSSTLDMSVNEDAVAYILVALRMNSSRIRVFNFDVSAHIENGIILRKLKTSYSSLEHLNFSLLYGGGLAEDLAETNLDFFGGVSALRSLSYQCYTGWKVRSRFPRHQLSRLVIRNVNAGEFLPILTGCNNLRELEISDTNDDLEEAINCRTPHTATCYRTFSSWGFQPQMTTTCHASSSISPSPNPNPSRFEDRGALLTRRRNSGHWHPSGVF